MISNNSLKIKILLLAAIILISTDHTNAENKPKAPAPTPARQWLEKLEAKSENMTSFHANIFYTRIQELLGDKQSRQGKVYLSRTKDKTQFAVGFESLIKDKKIIEQKKIFIFDGIWLIEKDYQNKIFIKRQVMQPGKKFDPLKLGEGPFPLPVGQKVSDVLAFFEVTLKPEDEKAKPENKEDKDKETFTLLLKPREDLPKNSPKIKFKNMKLTYYKKSLLPKEVETTDGKNTTIVKLFKAAMNELDKKQQAVIFDTTQPPASEGWDIIIKPFEQ